MIASPELAHVKNDLTGVMENVRNATMNTNTRTRTGYKEHGAMAAQLWKMLITPNMEFKLFPYFDRIKNDLIWEIPNGEISPKYAFADIANGDADVGMFSSQNCRIGLMLIGPNTLVPLHRHTAIEAYRILAGSALWKRDDQRWAS